MPEQDMYAAMRALGGVRVDAPLKLSFEQSIDALVATGITASKRQMWRVLPLHSRRVRRLLHLQRAGVFQLTRMRDRVKRMGSILCASHLECAYVLSTIVGLVSPPLPSSGHVQRDVTLFHSHRTPPNRSEPGPNRTEPVRPYTTDCPTHRCTDMYSLTTIDTAQYLLVHAPVHACSICGRHTSSATYSCMCTRLFARAYGPHQP